MLALALAPADPALAKGENVRFINRTGTTQHVLATFGADGKCADQPEKEQLALEPGEEAVVESGAATVCWCAASAGKIGDCGDVWRKAKPGSTQKISR